jgi:hypothetical protein
MGVSYFPAIWLNSVFVGLNAMFSVTSEIFETFGIFGTCERERPRNAQSDGPGVSIADDP